VRTGQLSGGTGFSPRIRILDDGGSQVGFATGAASSNTSMAAVELILPSTGDYTVEVDSALSGGTGTYRLHFFDLATSFTIPGGDHGGELTSGESRDGSITLGDLDIWTFQAAMSDRITVNVRQLSGGTTFAPKVRIYQANTLVGYAFDPAAITASEPEVALLAPGAGEFIAVVESGLEEGTGTYRMTFTLESGPFTYPTVAGEAMDNGAVNDGSISIPNEIDTWTFPVSAGDSVLVRLGETDNGTGLAPYLELFAPDGTSLMTDTAAADAWVETTAEVNGIYYVQVGDTDTGTNDLNDDTGSYRLEAIVLPESYEVSAGDEGGELTNGGLHEGTIHTGDIDTWTIQAEAGNTIQVRLGELDNGTGLYPHLALRAGDGTLLSSDSAAADGWVGTVATVAGNYFVQVTDWDTGTNDENDDTGSYKLEAVVTPGTFLVSPGDEGGELTLGELHEGAIHVGDLDTWTLQAEAGNTIIVRLGETDNGTGLYPYMELRGPDGALLDFDTSPADCWITLEAPATGTYFVQIADYDTGTNDENDDTGSYRLEAFVLPGDFNVSVADEGGAVIKGKLHEGVIHVGDMDVWTVQAEAGNTVLARVGETDNGTGLNPYVELRGTDGGLLDSDTSITEGWVTTVADETGTYFVLIADYDTGTNDDNDDTGSYRLEVTVLPGNFEVSIGDEGGTLVNGSNYEGTIHVGDVDTWTLEANAGNTIMARVGEVDNGTGLNPYVSLSGPDGMLLVDNTNASDAAVTTVANATGTYYIQIADADTGTNDENDDTGSYRLESVVASNPISVSDGDEGGPLSNLAVNEGMLSLGDIDPWTFEAIDGDRIRLQLVTEGAYPLIKVYSPSGAEVASGQSNAAARTVNLEFLTENSGQFTVVVQSLLAGGMGAYDLTYQRYNGSFTIPEEDPSGWGGWTATGAVWQIGQPVAENGP
ncbi:MAG: hypothetical protein KJT03_13540, partial [Verrucomicrobiae bacterium]|nr:hypothetical protein [Verrucomicrobiae bacterium]